MTTSTSPGRWKREVAGLEEYGRDAVVYSDYEVIDASSRHVEVFRAGRLSAPQFRMLLITDIPVNGCTVLVPRRCFEQTGLFDERLKAAQDYDMWFRLAGGIRSFTFRVLSFAGACRAGDAADDFYVPRGGNANFAVARRDRVGPVPLADPV
jgi:hypothetical protein